MSVSTGSAELLLSRLYELGFDPDIEQQMADYYRLGLVAARVVREERGRYMVQTETEQHHAVLRGALRHRSEGFGSELPAVGDWVAIAAPDSAGSVATIEHLLERRSVLVRGVAGRRTEAQVVAANVDTVFLLTAVVGDFSPRRLERYLTTVWEGGANPVIVITKIDLVDDHQPVVDRASDCALGAPVHAISTLRGMGLDDLEPYLTAGQTVAFVGSSGVGKSTLLNRLMGVDVQRVKEIRRRDGRGRHATTNRQMFQLPKGALVIDTPGMRELKLWQADEGLAETFADIEELASCCAFRDCRHEGEPGCAVLAAVDEGELSAARLEGYRKLQKELAFQARRTDEAASRAERNRWKQIIKQHRAKKRLLRDRGEVDK